LISSLSERDSFIVYSLAKGLIEKSLHLKEDIRDMLFGVLNLYRDFEDLDEPEGFSVGLVESTEGKFEMEEEEVVELATYKVVCLDSGKCVVPRDVGSNCCLF
jgi:hypothetical protein